MVVDFNVSLMFPNLYLLYTKSAWFEHLTRTKFITILQQSSIFLLKDTNLFGKKKKLRKIDMSQGQ